MTYNLWGTVEIFLIKMLCKQGASQQFRKVQQRWTGSLKKAAALMDQNRKRTIVTHGMIRVQ